MAERGDLFTSFIDTMYDNRIKNKDESLNIMFKLIMNSLYGRFGMNPNQQKTILTNTRADFSDISQYYKIHGIKPVTNTDYYIFNYSDILNDKVKYDFNKNKINNTDLKRLRSKGLKTPNSGVAVQIASAITAYARMEIYEYKKDDGVCYSDTDSIFTSNKLDDKYVSDTELGKMKLKCKIDKALFISPKLYYYKSGENIIIKSKGVPNTELKYEDIDKLYNEQSISIYYISNFIRKIKEFIITSSIKKITLTGKLNKRVKVYKDGK